MDVSVTRLNKVKNSCRVAGVVANIAFIITLVSSIIFFGLSVALIAQAESVNDEIANSGVSEVIEQVINVEDFEMTSSVPSMQAYFDSHNYVYVYVLLTYIIAGLIIAVVTTVLMGLLKKIFKIILESESPFDDKVIKYLRILFITFVIMMALTVNMPVALILGVIFVCVYNIFLYGKELQRLSDETL